MAVPKKKLSRARQRRRRAQNERLDKLNLVPCPQCHELKRPHSVCPNCGTFRGIKYLATEEDELE
ncbi:MAG: 50S ribosomal protein L32 [Chloroflexota bacterium]|nr:50S ribosomal protein L32 [Chloroflexota bacterium]